MRRRFSKYFFKLILCLSEENFPVKTVTTYGLSASSYPSPPARTVVEKTRLSYLFWSTKFWEIYIISSYNAILHCGDTAVGWETLGFYLFFPDARNTNIWPTIFQSQSVQPSGEDQAASQLTLGVNSVGKSSLSYFIYQLISHWKLLQPELQLEHLAMPKLCVLYYFIEITTSQYLIGRKNELLYFKANLNHFLHHGASH